MPVRFGIEDDLEAWDTEQTDSPSPETSVKVPSPQHNNTRKIEPRNSVRPFSMLNTPSPYREEDEREEETVSAFANMILPSEPGQSPEKEVQTPVTYVDGKGNRSVKNVNVSDRKPDLVPRSIPAMPGRRLASHKRPSTADSPLVSPHRRTSWSPAKLSGPGGGGDMSRYASPTRPSPRSSTDSVLHSRGPSTVQQTARYGSPARVPVGHPRTSSPSKSPRGVSPGGGGSPRSRPNTPTAFLKYHPPSHTEAFRLSSGMKKSKEHIPRHSGIALPQELLNEMNQLERIQLQRTATSNPPNPPVQTSDRQERNNPDGPVSHTQSQEESVGKYETEVGSKGGGPQAHPGNEKALNVPNAAEREGYTVIGFKSLGGVTDGHSWCIDPDVSPKKLSQVWWDETVFPNLFPEGVPGGKQWSILYDAISKSLKSTIEEGTAGVQDFVQKIYQLAFHEIYRRLPLFRGAVTASTKKISELEEQVVMARSQNIDRVKQLEEEVANLVISNEGWRNRALRAEQQIERQSEATLELRRQHARQQAEAKKELDQAMLQIKMAEQDKTKLKQAVEDREVKHAKELKYAVLDASENSNQEHIKKLLEIQSKNDAETTSLKMQLKLAESRQAYKAAMVFKTSLHDAKKPKNRGAVFVSRPDNAERTPEKSSPKKLAGTAIGQMKSLVDKNRRSSSGS